MTDAEFDAELNKVVSNIPAHLRHVWEAWLRAFAAERHNRATPAQKKLLARFHSGEDHKEQERSGH